MDELSVDGLADGLYERLRTRGLSGLISADDPRATFEGVDSADEPYVLARHVQQAVTRRLRAEGDSARRLALVNDLLARVDDQADEDWVLSPSRQLMRVAAVSAPGVIPIGSKRPRTPLADAALLTNTHGEPNLASEVQAELSSANEVDLLCAFVKWHGLRLLEDPLRELRGRGSRFRVITTTYMGATERNALDRLISDFGAEVRISYDTQRTRLHAKAWMFRRRTGYDTGYVGSSNLSRAAMLDGVEWNVRLSSVATPTLLEKFKGTFDTYWSDPTFEAYDPTRDRDRLDDAIAEAAGQRNHSRVTISLSGLQVRPFPYQQVMLDDLVAERELHDRHRNLVVAATGTGKTVVAALDYQQLCQAVDGRPSLLFVAHRQEILDQSVRTYREVLSDANFGEVFVGGKRPERWCHVFASVQSLHGHGVESIDPSAYEVVVIDEFHHGSAPTYQKILNHLRPTELLGLTATPERSDGKDVRDYFDGRVATELRLWDALGADLLCPFHYFAIADGTDLREIGWSKGRYDGSELSNVYTGNDARARIILKQLQQQVLDPGRMRALGFCVSVDHAAYMARAFNTAGIPAAVLTGTTPQREREQHVVDLKGTRINVIFTVDVFNEGVDVPEIDTVLFLRPTESATVFLQQLGRGLRRLPDKPVLTALDFVGHHRKEFRFDLKLRALTGLSRRQLERATEDEFPFLPAGCQISMDRKSREMVLTNIKGQVASRWPHLTSELRALGDVTLRDFIAQTGVELFDILRSDRSWTRLRRAASAPTRAGSSAEQRLLRRVRSLAHVDDSRRVGAYSHLLSDEAPDYDELGPVAQRLAKMLFFSFWPDGGGFSSYRDGLRALRDEMACRDEVRQVLDLSFDNARHQTHQLTGDLADVPIAVHARYQREEILSALDYATLNRRPSTFREGVAYSQTRNADILLVNLRKSQADFSPTTMYRDFPISPTLFHWESQSRETPASRTGQRYITGSSHVLLFVREGKTNEFGTTPYLFAGPAQYVSHQGERPIAITWQLRHPLPTDFFHAATLAAS